VAVTVEIILGDGGTAATAADAPGCTLSPEQFADLYVRWFPQVVDLCRRTGCGGDDPEDVAQEAFAKAWANRSTYVPGRPFWPWICTIAERSCVDRWRRSARDSTRFTSLIGVREVSSAQPDQIVEEASERALVRRAFEELRPVERRVIGLRAIEGWSYRDIAEFEDVSVDSVRATLHRSRSTLRWAYLKAVDSRPIAALLLWGRSRWTRAVESSGFERLAFAVLGATIAVTAVIVPAHEQASARPGRAAASASVAPPAAAPVETSTSSAGTPDAASARTPARPPGQANQGATTQPPGSSGRLLIDQAEDPEAAYFTQFATPNSRADTVFAAGYASGGCSLASCPALFTSTDGGRSWRRVPGTSYTGGQLLLPPSYPADPRLFVAGASLLQVSHDGGGSFETLAPVGGQAAISPAFSSTDPQILVGAATGWQYRDDLGTVAPLSWGATVGTARRFVFAPAYPADPRVLVSSTAPGHATTTQSVVTTCRQSVCDDPVVLSGSTGTASIILAPSFASSGFGLAWRGDRLYRTTDGGRTFTLLALPTESFFSDVVFGADDAVYAAMWSIDKAVNRGGLFVSRDQGATWSRLGSGTSLDRGSITVVPLSASRLLAAPNGTERGLLCSVDAGATWSARCPN
jgi:RNA polymerase sigma-70 factor (ECF subfamily)